MEIRWTDEPRAIVVEVDDRVDEVPVERGAVVDLPIDVARSLIAQGLAVMKNDPAKARARNQRAAAKAAAVVDETPAPPAEVTEEPDGDR